MKETFGEYIKRLRTENGFTLTQLAAKLDLDSANLSKIENNKREFDERRLILLSEVFNLEINKLRTEFFSDLIAKKIYKNNCDEETLVLAEEKVAYLKSKNPTTVWEFPTSTTRITPFVIKSSLRYQEPSRYELKPLRRQNLTQSQRFHAGVLSSYCHLLLIEPYHHFHEQSGQLLP